MVDSVNKICRLLDFDYHLAILCPFDQESYALKPLVRPDVNSSEMSDDQFQSSMDQYIILYNEDEESSIRNCFDMAGWIESYFPCFGQYDPCSSFSMFFLRFYESVLSQFSLLNNYLIKFHHRRKGNFSQGSISLPQFTRSKDRKVAINDSVNVKNSTEKKFRQAKMLKALNPRKPTSKVSLIAHKKSASVKTTTESAP